MTEARALENLQGSLIYEAIGSTMGNAFQTYHRFSGIVSTPCLWRLVICAADGTQMLSHDYIFAKMRIYSQTLEP